MKLTSAEIRNLNNDEVREKLNQVREELMKLRFRHSSGELTDYTQIRATRRTIARLSSALTERMAKAETEDKA